MSPSSPRGYSRYESVEGPTTRKMRDPGPKGSQLTSLMVKGSQLPVRRSPFTVHGWDLWDTWDYGDLAP
jgi:hypothetical protein